MKQTEFRQQTELLENPINTEVFGVYLPDDSLDAISAFQLTDEELKKINETKVIYVKQNVANGFRILELHAFMKSAGLPISGANWIALMDEYLLANYIHDLQLRWPGEDVNNTALKNPYPTFKDFIHVSLGLSKHQIDEGWKKKVVEWEKIAEMHKEVKM